MSHSIGDKIKQWPDSGSVKIKVLVQVWMANFLGWATNDQSCDGHHFLRKPEWSSNFGSSKTRIIFDHFRLKWYVLSRTILFLFNRLSEVIKLKSVYNNGSLENDFGRIGIWWCSSQITDYTYFIKLIESQFQSC